MNTGNQATTLPESEFDPLKRLITLWRARAEENRRLYYDEARAHLISTMTTELEGALKETEDLELTYAEVARLMRWAPGTVRNKVSAGELENVGTRSEPRVRLGALVRGSLAVLAARSVLEQIIEADRPGAQAQESEEVTRARERARRRFSSGP